MKVHCASEQMQSCDEQNTATVTQQAVIPDVNTVEA